MLFKPALGQGAVTSRQQDAHPLTPVSGLDPKSKGSRESGFRERPKVDRSAPHKFHERHGNKYHCRCRQEG